MRVVIVTGIFPPDIGGPATHAADVAGQLRRRGHQVTVLTLTDEPGQPAPADLVRYPRRWPWPRRALAVAAWLFKHGDDYDVAYATGMGEAAVLGGRLAGRPVILKIVGDPAWERGVRQGKTSTSFDDFQDAGGGGLALRAMRWVRNWSVRRATARVTPSRSV